MLSIINNSINNIPSSDNNIRAKRMFHIKLL